LAASPDEFVYDRLEDPPYGKVDFKNPYSARNSTLCEAAIKVYPLARIKLENAKTWIPHII